MPGPGLNLPLPTTTPERLSRAHFLQRAAIAVVHSEPGIGARIDWAFDAAKAFEVAQWILDVLLFILSAGCVLGLGFAAGVAHTLKPEILAAILVPLCLALMLGMWCGWHRLRTRSQSK